MGGANIPNTGNATADFQQLMKGTNYTVGNAPSLQLAQQGAMHDWLSLNQAQQDTAKRNTQFFDQAMAGMSEAQKNLSTTSPAFDKAYGFQQQLVDQTTADRADFDKQLKAAEAKYQNQMGRVEGTYNQAIGAINEGRDRAASEMADAMRQNYEADRLKGLGALAGQGISPDQMAEADRQSKWEMERGVGANVSNLQFQGAQAKAGILQAKAGAMQNMAATQANLSTTVAQLGMQSAGAKQEAIKLGAQIALANAADDQQRAQMSAQYQAAMGEFGASWMAANPIMATMFGGLITQLGQASSAAGGSPLVDNAANMRDRVRSEISRAQSAMAPRGFGQGVDVKALIMAGMQVPGISREAMQWIQQNGLPPDHIIVGEFGGAGRMGFAEGQAPTGLGSTAKHDQFGYNHAAETSRRAAEQMPKK
jgi:hypothetical protein